MGARVQRTSLVLLVTIAVHSLGFGDSRDLSLVARPVFEGVSGAQFGALPFIVEVANRGENTRGEVILRSSSLITRYPLDLPRGSKKRFFAYQPDYTPYDEVWIELETTQGGLSFPIRQPEDTSSEYMCLIGGNSGDMTFLRTEGPADYESRFRDAYGKPGSLPDRPSGFSALTVVVLGEGAERMGDAEVEALKGWVVSGGTLVFLGGVSAPILQDARWQSFLPVHSVRQVNVSSIPRIESLGGSAPPAGVISLAVGQPSEGAVVKFASAGNDLIVEKRVGLGHAVYLALDPFQPPLKQWEGLRKLFRNGFNTERALLSRIWLMERNYNRQQSYYPMADAIDSPFNVSLPSPGIVLLILFAHLVVSVPVNFYVMRKLGRGELAWVTTPLISVAFAAVFFSLASGLYEAGQSTRSRGVLLASSLHPTAIFKGTSEVFIPRGGSYDLRLSGVDLVSSAWGSDYYYGESGDPLEVVDDGSVRMPNLRVSNLSFKEFAVTQQLSAKLVTVAAQLQGVDKMRIEISNLSNYGFDNATVQYANRLYNVGKIAPGGQFRGVVAGSKYTQDRWSGEKLLVLKATIDGYRPGPQIGQDIESSIELIYFGGVLK